MLQSQHNKRSREIYTGTQVYVYLLFCDYTYCKNHSNVVVYGPLFLPISESCNSYNYAIFFSILLIEL